MKKITAFCLTLLMLLSVLSLSACSGGGSTGLEFELNEDGSSYTVVGMGTCEDTELVIPEKYEGLPVTAVGDGAFLSCVSLTSITIPSSVKTIGEKAFAYCNKLSTLTFEGGVTSIGAEAFHTCAGLTSVVLPEGLTTLGDRAFAYCTHVTDFTFPGTLTSIGERVLENCKTIERVVFTGTKEAWNSIDRHEDWCYTTMIERIHCTDGVVAAN